MNVNELIEELSKYSDKFGDFDVQIGDSNVTGIRFGNGCNFILQTDYATPSEDISWNLDDMMNEVEEACDSLNELEEELDESITEEASSIIDDIKWNLDSIESSINSIGYKLRRI